MGNCEKCMFYDKEYDDALESDVIGLEERRHYCIMHKHGIRNNVWNGKEKCSDYTEEI